MTALTDRFERLTTPHLADACVRLGIPVRCAPAEIHAMTPGMRMLGRALPARHSGSVDVFLEAIDQATPGDVLVADNRGRVDESCIGDLMAQEARTAGLAGIVMWGLHRDTAEIREIGIPLFSCGSIPTGPLAVDDRAPAALQSALIGEWTVDGRDLVAADVDGVLFLPLDRADEVFTAAEGIRDTERAQAEQIAGGTSLREQVRFADYLAARAEHPELTFREHLRAVGGEIEV
ncbi:MAG: RraA family protein [Rhodoglobus sp.]